MASQNLPQNPLPHNRNLTLKIEVGFSPERKQFGALAVAEQEQGYGLGSGETITEAAAKAIDDLLSKIPQALGGEL